MAASIDPKTIPGSEPFLESAFQPIVIQKRDLLCRNKIKGNPSKDAEYNKCAKNARIKWRKRNNDDTLTCVDRWRRDLGQSDSNDMRPWKDAMAERWKLKQFTEEDAAEFDAICDAAELAKVTMEFDQHTATKQQLRQVFGDHYKILPSDEFKRTGVQQNQCGEFGSIVASQRVLRGRTPLDNTPDPNVRAILGPKKEFTQKAPAPHSDAPDTGGASGSRDRADQTAHGKR